MRNAKCILVWRSFFPSMHVWYIFCMERPHTHSHSHTIHKRTTKRQEEEEEKEQRTVKWFRMPRRTLKRILLNIRWNAKCSWRDVVKREIRRRKERCMVALWVSTMDEYHFSFVFDCYSIPMYDIAIYTYSSLNSWDFREFDFYFHLCAVWIGLVWFGSFICLCNESPTLAFRTIIRSNCEAL